MLSCGCCARGTYVKSRSWPSEHLRSNRCEDAVGLSSCQTSENIPSRDCLSEKGPSNAPAVHLAGIQSTKSAKKELLGGP